MKWIKQGLIYCPDGESSWAKNSALQPTPVLLENGILRIYLGLRDDYGVSRIGFVDVDARNPAKVLSISKEPALDIGVPGAFDDNGVVPTAIVQREGKYFLYYAGYQIPKKVKFLAFAGLATSENGKVFTRLKQVPVMDRTDRELYFRVPHSVIFENGVWRVWYGGGSKFIEEKGKVLPVYDIKYTESYDGLLFDKPGTTCIQFSQVDEYRIGRPYVLKDEEIYRMFYGTATKTKGYRLGYAQSVDGVNWKRKDEEVGIDVSTSGWDSQMIAYPAVVKYEDKTYLFYNGNDMGRSGFGYALLSEW